MRLTIKEKLQMCAEQVIQGKTLSHTYEKHNFKDIYPRKNYLNEDDDIKK